jgi:hypothetical protein
MSTKDPELSERVACAIDLIHSVGFVCGRSPLPHDGHWVHQAYAVAKRFGFATPLCVFEEADIPPTAVAEAARVGVLDVVEVPK